MICEQDSVERLGLGLKEDQLSLLWSVMDGEGSGELEFEEFQKLFLLEPILLSLINSADISIAKVDAECRDLDPGKDGPQVRFNSISIQFQFESIRRI